MLARTDVVEQARMAWDRIKNRSRPLFDDWLLIGAALVLGRAACMASAGCKTPYGPAYQAQIKRWLAENGLDDLDSHERLGAIYCHENQAAIEKWRTGLSEAERRRCNHPNTILKHFRDKTAPQRHGPKTVGNAHRFMPVTGWVGRPSADMIKRVATAIRQNWTTDTFRLACIIIEATARDPDLALMFVKPVPNNRKPVAVAELHA